ncbi:MAG: ACP S-malonyltransferase [Alphaproteobacteria bacterium]
MTRAFIFPGQGSQAVGMGADLATAFGAAHQVFEEVDDALGERLSRLMQGGPEADLVLTANAQPAIMAVSIAVVRALEAELGAPLMTKASFVAGHSLGEWSALVAAGALGVADAARLLRLRGRAMQEAVPVGAGAMTALLGVDAGVAQAIAAEAALGEVCSVANDNAPGQVVLSGAARAIDRAEALAPAKGAKRCVRLTVSAPFHCALMAPAAERVAEALATQTLRAPAVPVVANATAEPVDQPAAIRRLLVDQVTATVRWRESVLRLKAAGVATLVELGQGKVLSGLVKRIDRDLVALSAATPAELDAVLASL